MVTDDVLQLLRSAELRAEEEDLLASHPATLQIRPPVGSARIGRTERRPHLMRAAVETGFRAAMAALATCVLEPR